MERSMPSPIEELIADLANSNQLLPDSRLTELSNLTSEEVNLFEQAWAGIKPRLRRKMITQLVELAEDDVALNFDIIFRHCLKDTDAEVRTKAIEGLWESEDASLINPLIELLEQDSSEKVRAVAATVLGNFAMLAEYNKLPSGCTSRIEQALLTVSGDKTRSMGVRCRALEAVATLSQPQVRKAIMDAYQSPSSQLKASATCAMGKNCDRFWLPILLRELTSADDKVRYEAAEACGELGEEESVPNLIELVNDFDAEVALAAIKALGRIGGIEAKECLRRLVGDPEKVIQQAAQEALAQLEIEEAPFSSGV